jgi:hypothetical protein
MNRDHLTITVNGTLNGKGIHFSETAQPAKLEGEDLQIALLRQELAQVQAINPPMLTDRCYIAGYVSPVRMAPGIPDQIRALRGSAARCLAAIAALEDEMRVVGDE